MFTNFEQINNPFFLLGVGAAAVLLLGAPYAFKIYYAIFGGEQPELPVTVIQLLARYVWGVGSILVGVYIWLTPLGHIWTAHGVAFISAIGGGVVVFRYISDHAPRVVNRNRMIEQHDREING